jgi:uncharacterized protein (DUF2164 family)
MTIKLDAAWREHVTAHLQKHFSNSFDEKLSDFRAAEIIDLMLKTLGPAIYNQAVQDVRAHLQGKLDDLDGEVYADGGA